MKIEQEIKDSRFRNEYHKGAINLIYTVKQLSAEFAQYMKKYQVTEQQYNILKVLRGFRSQAPISIGFIKERMLDKSSDVSRIVDKLYEKQLVDRRENPADRRQKEIVITQKGLDLLATTDECEQQVDLFLTKLSIEEVQELNRLLDKVRE